MKKSTFFLTFFIVIFATFTISAQITDTIVSLVPTGRNVLLEVFTADGCGSCPQGDRTANELAAANPGRVNVISIFTGMYSSDTYTTQFGSALANQSNLAGYPQGTVNRHIFSGSGTAMYRQNWATSADQILSLTSPVNMAAEGTLDWTTRTLNIRVQLYYTADQAVTSNALNIAIIQDNIMGPQSGGYNYNPTQMAGDEYNHKNMLRHLITGQWGDTIHTISQGTLVEKTYQYVIPEQLGSPNALNAVLQDLRFIAFVCEGNQEVLTSMEIPVQLLNAPDAEQAQPTLTVADSTLNGSISPIYTGYSDYFTRNQVIYPASMLSDMEETEISAITFYLKTLPAAPWTCVFEAKLKIVNEDQFYNTNYYSTDNIPASYTGTAKIYYGSTVTFDLDTPFVYNGGNLLLELATTATGVNRSAYFYGISSTNGSLYNYNSYSGGSYITTGTRGNFIPKTTFTFTYLDTCRPRHLEVIDIVGSSALVTWKRGHSTTPHPFEVSYRVMGAADWTVAAASTNDEFLLLTGLQPQTDYQVRVRSLCGGGYSDYITASFSTECTGGYTDPIPVGVFTNPSTYPYPLYLGQKYCYTQEIYKASEINGAKRMNGISVQYVNSSYTATRNINIYLGHTTQEDFSNSSWIPNADLNLVYSGTVTFNNSGEDHWFWIPFDTIFNYNGTDNLVVAFDDNTGTSLSSANRFYNHYSYASTKLAYSSSDIDPNDPTTGYNYTQNYRANILMPGNCIADGCDRANVTVTSITDSTANLQFTPGDGATGIELQFKRAVDTAFIPLSTTGNTLQLTGLQHNTEYTVRIRSLCTDSQSNWKEITFTTPVRNLPRVYVSVGGTGDGASWTTAAGDLNWAINTAAAIHNTFGNSPDVWVSEGVYYGDGVSADAFTMVEGVNVYGGFVGNEPADYNISLSEPADHPTILDGQHSQRVLNQPANFMVRTFWDGFVIRNGYTTDNGGGAQLKNAASLYNCVFLDNTGYNGGGIYAYSTNETGNGAIDIENCQFRGNVATSNGGGIYANYVMITHSSFTHNRANSNGGGVYINYASQFFPALSNCLIANNTANTGGGIYNYSGASTIENSTIVNNSASSSGAGLWASGMYRFVNNIVWGNRTAAGAVSNIDGNITCQYSAVEGGYSGEGNVMLQPDSILGGIYTPHFVHPSATVGYTDSTLNVDWHLQNGSVCVNRGSNSLMGYYNTSDLDFSTRIRHDTVDMGCYESNYGSSVLPAYGDVIYVTQNGNGTQDGSSWANATSDIILAKSLAEMHGADVWVAEGVYYGNTQVGDAFTLSDGVSLYGGFAGNETSLSQRDLTAHVTALDGGNVRSVIVQPSSFANRTIIDGFTIRNGRYTGNNYGGGGAFLNNNVTFSNCIFTNNQTTNTDGGGVYVYGTWASGITDSVYFLNCTFSYNTSNKSGGGAYLYHNSVVRNCTFTHNTAGGQSGGLYIYEGSVSHSVFTYNTAATTVGGLNSTTPVSNCLIANNTAGTGTSAIAAYNVNSCTIVNNTSNATNSSSGSAVTGTTGTNQSNWSVYTNCIIWGNRNNGNPANIYANIACTHSAVEGGYDGEGNIALTSSNTGTSPLCPRFVNPSTSAGASNTTDNVDWRLAYGSPCVNRGDNTGADSLDLAGNDRIQQGTIDMGCYESEYDSVSLPQYGNIIYVTAQGAGTQFGDSWENATSSIEDAQALAQANDAVVWVAAGTYYGNTSADNAFNMVEGVNVYGGFAGNEPADYDLSQRDFETNATILDGQNQQRVLNQPANFTEATAVTWDGFTIQNGQTSWYGAGVYLQQYCTLSHCIIQNNTSTYYSSTGDNVTLFGAGVFSYITLSDGMRPNIISDCIIRYNSFEDNSNLYGRGAGLCTKGTKIIRTEICHNSGSQTYGGGIFSYPNDTLSNCSIHDNSAERGGGIYSNADNIITDCLIYNNSAQHGGGIYSNANDNTANCLIYNNNALYGGGIYSTADDITTNCLIHNNSAQFGGGIFINSGSSEYTNCDMVNNTATSNGGGIYNNYGTGTFTNCLFWGNIRGSNIINSLSNRSGYNNNCTYCAVEGGYDGTGNINLASDNDGNDVSQYYVRFVDPENSDFRLQTTSACIDAGNSNAEIGDRDLYGNPRLNGTVDIGCYELPCTITELIEATACNSYTWNDITYTASGEYVQTFTTADECDSVVTLNLTVNYSTHNVLTETACESYVWNDTTYAESGTYTYAYTNSDGCESSDTLHLTVYPVFNTPVEAEICDGDGYSFFDTMLTTAGTYTHMLQSVNGCDSVITMTLTVNPVFNTPVEAEICEGSSYIFFDSMLTTVGTYTHTLQTVHGCDSVITLTLTVNPIYNTQLTAVICEGDNYNFFDTTLTTAGTYTHTLQTVNGCDSIITLTLTVNPTYNFEYDLDICEGESLHFNGEIITESGTYTQTSQTVNGCDSIVTIVLTVHPIENTPVTAAICEGSSYSFFDSILTTAGTYTHTLQSVLGCDSVITLSLTVQQPVSGVDERTACDSLTWIDGVTYYESTNTPTFTLTSVAGCDSVVTLHLLLNHAESAEFAETVCESFEWNGETFTSSGDYTRTLTNTAGCDSVVTLHLTVNHGTHNVEIETACESFTWHGETYTMSGTYTYAYTNASGCASADTLHLTVNHGTHNVETETACEIFTWHGETYTTSGTYTYAYTNASGCTSVDTLLLTVNYSATSEFSIETTDSCYEWNYETYCESGDYTQTLQTVNGCDSVVTLHLTITVGIDDHDLLGIEVFPNPTNRLLNIQGENMRQILIYNADGQIVFTKKVDTEDIQRVDVSQFAAGQYFVKVLLNDNQTITKRVIVNHQ